MIRVWLSRESAIPIREQLSAQLLLGIVSKRLTPGERLPSIRELARYLRIHANTVSKVYQDLAGRGWLERRRGSGVYVREVGFPANEDGIEGFVRTWIEAASQQGFTIEALQSSLGRVAHPPRPKELLVIDAEIQLAGLLAAEIADSVSCPVSFGEFDNQCPRLSSDTCVLALPAHMPRVLHELRPASFRTIRLKSMEDLLAGHQRPSFSALIAVVSKSESIHHWTSTLLSALGFPPTAILQRTPGQPGWTRGLSACDIIVADLQAAGQLPGNVGAKTIIIKIVSPHFLLELTGIVTPQEL